MGPKNEVLKEGQTKAWDPLQTIELEKLSTKLVSKVSELEGTSSLEHFYIFNRTLKHWTTGTLVNIGFEMSFGSLLVALGSLGLPCSNMDHLFRPKSTDLRCLCIKMSMWEFSGQSSGSSGFAGNGGCKCSSDLPSTRVRVLHMTVVDVTNSLK